MKFLLQILPVWFWINDAVRTRVIVDWAERERESEMFRRCCYKINIRLCSHYIKMLNYSVSIKNRSGFPVLSSTNFSKYLCFLVDFQFLFPLIYRVYYAILTRFWLFLSLCFCAHQQIFSLLLYVIIRILWFTCLPFNRDHKDEIPFCISSLHFIIFFFSFSLFFCQVVNHTQTLRLSQVCDIETVNSDIDKSIHHQQC